MSDEETFDDFPEAFAGEVSESCSNTVNLPSDIDMNSMVVEVAMHPYKNIITAGTIDGPVRIFSYTDDKSRSNRHLLTFKHHKESCRAVQFSSAGDYLFTGSSDKTIHAIDLNVGAVTRRLSLKQGAAIYCLLSIDNYLLASGDDDGKLIIWDFRKQMPIMIEKPCGEYISSLTSSHNKRTVLATSGEGSVVAFNLRSKKFDHQSEIFESEFFTAAIMRKETKVVVSTGNGILNIFNWGEWDKISDRITGHPGSLDTIARFDDDIVCTGCEDGKIRAVQLVPKTILGVIGNHEKFPVEGLAISHDKRFIVSCSYDQKVKFHDLSVIEKLRINEKPVSRVKRKHFNFNSCDFFSGLG